MNIAQGIATITLPMPWELESVNVHLGENRLGISVEFREPLGQL